eukprot:4931772-Alexandrium_andersonii.AAC.1
MSIAVAYGEEADPAVTSVVSLLTGWLGQWKRLVEKPQSIRAWCLLRDRLQKMPAARRWFNVRGPMGATITNLLA